MILASIVTYNPDLPQLQKNVESIVRQVKSIIIIDNNSNNIANIEREIVSKFSNIYIIKNNENIGISGALNIALDYAKTNEYGWLLTLDQDSVCNTQMISKYNRELNSLSNENILLYSPIISDVNKNETIEIQEGITELNLAITSGSLINVESAFKIGKFDTELFIDYVDFDFCLKGKLEGYKILRVNDAILYHTLGDIKEYRLGPLKLIATNHSPNRRYYLFRNKFYLYRKYLFHFPQWVIRDNLSSIKTLIIILLFEKNKFSNFKNSIKGIYDSVKL